MVLLHPAGHACAPSWRTQRLSEGSPDPFGTQTLLSPQPPPALSVPQASIRCCHGSLFGKSATDGAQLPGDVTAGGLVVVHESAMLMPSRLIGLWQAPSWSAGVQSWFAPRPQLAEPGQHAIPGGEHVPPWSGLHVQAVHCA